MRKKKNIKLKVLPIIIALVSIVIVIAIIILINILKQNYIVYENIKLNTSASTSEIKESNIVIANNIIIGGYINR